MRTLCGTILAAVLSLSANANSVASFCERAKKGDRLTVAFLGGSRKEEWFSWRLVRTWEGRSEEHLN